MNNIIECKLESTYKEIFTGIWQYDYGQKLRITGKNFPKTVEIQFSLHEKSGSVITRIGITTDGVTEVKIPDELLKNEGHSQDYSIYAYIYLTDETSGNTEYQIVLHVKSRTKPENPSEEPLPEPNIFHETVVAVNASAERAEKAVSDAENIRDNLNLDLSEKITRPDTAKVGQVLTIKAIDKNGKPTEVEAKSITGGASEGAIEGAVKKYLEEHAIQESDPTVPAWAKEEEKPTYTAEEVGALPSTTKIPKNLSDLQDDAEHRTVTDTEKQSWNNKSDFDGNYESLKGKPTIPTVPNNLPNPQSLTITYGGKTHVYDGSEALAITIETGGIERIEKLSTDTTVTLEPNKLYIFPEMASLTYTLAEPADASVANEYHFVFKSGSTATELVHPSTVNVGNFSIDANKVYEVSILEGLLTSQSWAVS